MHGPMDFRFPTGHRERKLIHTAARRGYILETPVAKEAVAADDKVSILVGPPSDQSADVNGEYVADGLTEVFITELSKVRSSRVNVLNRGAEKG
ncbi:MAG: hypothetical protein P8X98_00510 [Woeseiaceae bacterium]